MLLAGGSKELAASLLLMTTIQNKVAAAFASVFVISTVFVILGVRDNDPPLCHCLELVLALASITTSTPLALPAATGATGIPIPGTKTGIQGINKHQDTITLNSRKRLLGKESDSM
jgi:hypothetical protein